VALDSDEIVDRRRVKRRLILWRTLAIVLLIAFAGVFLAEFRESGDYVARIAVTGVIRQDHERDSLLERIASDTRAKALIVRIDSPGGTVVGGETLYRRLRAISEKKPVVAVMDTLATSAAYMTALGSDRIFAHDGTVTGSIGVILQAAEFTGLLNNLGIRTETFKSGPLKAAPSPLEPVTPEVREATMRVVADIFDMFVDIVAERRKFSKPDTLRLADGRVFTGRQALKEKLIDSLGGETAARDWLAAEKGVARSLPLRDMKVEFQLSDLRTTISTLTEKTVLSETLTLDGLVSLWHPQLY